MASRKEQKERLRREREEAERAAKAAEARRKRLTIAGGAVLAVVAAIGIGLAVASGGGDDEPGGASGDGVPIPAVAITDLDEAAEAAGCRVQEHESEGQGHTSETVQYRTNPPTSGSHDPTPAQDGLYEADNPPDIEQSVHALEHGRVNIQYRVGTPQRRIDQLETLASEEVRGTPGFHTLLFQNQTQMRAAVAATSWTRSLTCPQFNDQVFDAIRAFREKAIAGEWEADIPEPVP
jgi:hypothetical protein